MENDNLYTSNLIISTLYFLINIVLLCVLNLGVITGIITTLLIYISSITSIVVLINDIISYIFYELL